MINCPQLTICVSKDCKMFEKWFSRIHCWQNCAGIGELRFSMYRTMLSKTKKKKIKKDKLLQRVWKSTNNLKNYSCLTWTVKYECATCWKSFTNNVPLDSKYSSLLWILGFYDFQFLNSGPLIPCYIIQPGVIVYLSSITSTGLMTTSRDQQLLLNSLGIICIR